MNMSAAGTVSPMCRWTSRGVPDESGDRHRDSRRCWAITARSLRGGTMTFVTPGTAPRRHVGRDLLMLGVGGPVGDGDVHVAPALNASGAAVVLVTLELSSPDGHLVLRGQAPTCEEFLARSAAIVRRAPSRRPLRRRHAHLAGPGLLTESRCGSSRSAVRVLGDPARVQAGVDAPRLGDQLGVRSALDDSSTSTTITSSALSAVDSRCAIVTDVRDCMSRLSARPICISSGGRRRWSPRRGRGGPGRRGARSSATSCRSPAESDSPRCPTLVCSPRQPRRASREAELVAEARISASVASSRP